MNRSGGNVSSTKKLYVGAGNNSKTNRKPPRHLSESSTLSSDRNSSVQSEEDVRIPEMYAKTQVICESPEEQQEQLIKKLKAQIKDLRHKMRVLEEAVESKDYSLGTLAREKDRAIGEVRRLERSNRQLRQQLTDERSHYLEEKEKFCVEMTRYKKKLQETKTQGEDKKTPSVTRQPLINQSLRWQLNNEKGDSADVKSSPSKVKTSKSQNFLEKRNPKNFTLSESQLTKASSLKSFYFYDGDDVSLQMAVLKTENAKLRSIICERDELNYELCLRFLRMKHCKNDIKSRFQELENEYLQVIANLMDKIDEARQEFNFIIDQKFKRPLHSTNAMYLQLVQKNSRMAFENASLRLENQCLKKELNRHTNNASNCARKPEQSNGDFRVPLGDSNTDGKLKRTKKNVNFQEIRTIYDRGFAFRNSDTDSNYMSKTSTTVPSIRSLPDVKSTESVVECELDEQEKASTSFQTNALPEDILKKLFKRIDTPSSQSIQTGRPKEITSSDVTTRDDTADDSTKENLSTVVTDVHANDKKEKSKHETAMIEHKSPPKITDSSSVCGSKESLELKGFDEPGNCPPMEFILRLDDAEKEEFLEDENLFLRNRIRARIKDYIMQEVGEKAQDASGGHLIKRNRLGRHERIQQSNQEREHLKRCSKMSILEFKDCCALQENFVLSGKELLPQPTGQRKNEKGSDVSGGQREKTENNMARINLQGSEDEAEDTGGLRGRFLAPAVGSRSKSSNKVNLQDELVDALMKERDQGDPARKRTVKSKTSTIAMEIKENATATAVEAGTANVRHARRTEGSKRFSHRLISTSPETLRHILKESQLGSSYRMGSIVVDSATTEMESAFEETENTNRIFLHLVIPKSAAEQPPQAHVSKVARETSEMVEKETSVSDLIPPKSTIKVEMCQSGVRIPASNLQASNSTIEIVESTNATDENDIMLRTLSAPGLLESNWLDQYTFCETKDNGTNT